MSTFSSYDLKSLVGLLSLKDDADSEDSDYERITPGNCHHLFGAAERPTRLQEDKKPICKQALNNSSKNIWDDDEIPDEEDDEAINKIKPEYEMVYQQSVTPDDVFLQLSGKGPGTDSCDRILIKIKLPGIHSKEDVNLNVSSLKLICKTNKYYLNLDLPKEVDPPKCCAKWDESQSLLVVTLFLESMLQLHH